MPKSGVASDQPVDQAELAIWPSSSSILAKFVEVAGGEAALKQVTTRIEKGGVMAGGHQLPIEIFAKSPDQRVSIMHFASGESVTA